jgi:hypothetical protein
MMTDVTAEVPDDPPVSVRVCSHELWVGDQPLRLPATRSALGVLRELSGHGIPAEQFPLYLRGNGEVQLAASVGSALVRLPAEELALA